MRATLSISASTESSHPTAKNTKEISTHGQDIAQRCKGGQARHDVRHQVAASLLQLKVAPRCCFLESTIDLVNDCHHGCCSAPLEGLHKPPTLLLLLMAPPLCELALLVCEALSLSDLSQPEMCTLWVLLCTLWRPKTRASLHHLHTTRCPAPTLQLANVEQIGGLRVLRIDGRHAPKVSSHIKSQHCLHASLHTPGGCLC